jgi:transcriptional regulator with XRE-family HTH domain
MLATWRSALPAGKPISHTPPRQQLGDEVDVATDEQREMFRRALQRARRERGLSQRELSKALSLSHSTVSFWERGESIPAIDNVIELERVLDLQSGELSRLLGYMPLVTMRQEMIGVLDAIVADPELGADQRELLMTMYRELVRQARQHRGERKAGQEARPSGASDESEGGS